MSQENAKLANISYPHDSIMIISHRWNGQVNSDPLPFVSFVVVCYYLLFTSEEHAVTGTN